MKTLVAATHVLSVVAIGTAGHAGAQVQVLVARAGCAVAGRLYTLSTVASTRVAHVLLRVVARRTLVSVTHVFREKKSADAA